MNFTTKTEHAVQREGLLASGNQLTVRRRQRLLTTNLNIRRRHLTIHSIVKLGHSSEQILTWHVVTSLQERCKCSLAPLSD